MRETLGSCELTWYVTNTQRAFVFMADQTTVIYEEDTQPLHFDPQFLKQVLKRDEAKEDEQISFLGRTAKMLECKFQNPDYGRQIAARLMKRLIKNWGPQQLLLVPNYGNAAPKDSTLFWRLVPCVVDMRQITFHILPNHKGERTLRGV